MLWAFVENARRSHGGRIIFETRLGRRNGGKCEDKKKRG